MWWTVGNNKIFTEHGLDSRMRIKLNGPEPTSVAAKRVIIGSFVKFCELKKRRSICCKDANDVKYEARNGISIDDFLDEEVELENAPELSDVINREQNIEAALNSPN